MAYLAETQSKLAIPRTLLKDPQSQVDLGEQFYGFRCDFMTRRVWILTTGRVKPALRLFGTSLVLSIGRC